ncbi:hypothetical protein SVA_0877 [Sulfurifustis variabilis]|uniref:Uncharacterized protein n=1 Tax=Sulfurifustis variabilis TaxID=1675686 RepID=A0A1B4V1T2_9GAMM|nr:hypothetical protein [Sulfurifustis variabilis]BAU47456.1 hypothetical protein SVA_0877 [Sulfurifustis variabilis]
MVDALGARFRETFFAVIQEDELARALKQAASDANLGAWTRALTEAAIRTCSRLGLMASAKGHKLELLPIHRNEYLALDVMAFSEGEKRWRFPAAVMELENSARDDQIAYSLWKVLSVRAELRIVFCYRRNGEEIPALLRHLREEVIEAMGLAGRVKLDGATLLVVGSRSESGTFPFGYFGWWSLDTNTGRFERL